MRLKYTFLPLCVCVCMCDHTSSAMNLVICHVVNGKRCVFVCVRVFRSVSIWLRSPWLQLGFLTYSGQTVMWCTENNQRFMEIYCAVCSVNIILWIDFHSCACVCACACVRACVRARGLVKFCLLPAVWMAMGECKCYIIEIYVFPALQGTGAGVCGFTRESNGHS